MKIAADNLPCVDFMFLAGSQLTLDLLVVIPNALIYDMPGETDRFYVWKLDEDRNYHNTGAFIRV